jgi:hypothetical protein
VPTVRFADGSALTNPSLSDVKAALAVLAAGETEAEASAA